LAQCHLNTMAPPQEKLMNKPTVDIVSEKIEQIPAILIELDIDLWFIFLRETSMMADPMLSLVVGDNVTWQSCFFFSRSGEHVALVGDLDKDIIERSGRFSKVLTYTENVNDDIQKTVKHFDPNRIAINYSENNVAADGLTHGMYLLLKKYLDGTEYINRLVSAETICSKVRSRKTKTEIEYLGIAAQKAVSAWENALPLINVGMTEIEIGAILEKEIEQLGLEPSFETIVNAGDKTNPGHGHPTNAVLEPGDLLHVDFGVVYNEYCSDLQRLLYFPRSGESVPPELIEAFDTVVKIITETAQKCVPGVKGFEIDKLAREILAENGYEEYQHALGHQLGRSVHDGGGIIGPQWGRYGNSPLIELENSNAYTLELEIILPGIGCVGLEEDICVTKNGGRFLCPRQLEIITK